MIRNINFNIPYSNGVFFFGFCLCFAYMFSFLMKQNSPYLQMKMTHVQLSLVQQNVHVQQAIQEFHARVSFNTLKS